MPAEDEHVLCVPTALFREVCDFQGFRADADALGVLLDPRHTVYLPRPAAERDPSFKQLIPYCLLVAGTPAGPRVWAYTRSGGGEGRLDAKVSVGVGGHVSTLDRDAAGDTYDLGMRRELVEEVDVPGGYDDCRVGLINDDATEVGRVHLGVVHRLDLHAGSAAGGGKSEPGPDGRTLPQVRPREATMTAAGFRDPAALLVPGVGLESWSRIALEALFGDR